MALTSKRCPACGKVEQGNEFIRNFCPNCFTQRNQVGKITEEITVKRCAVCSRIFVGNAWTDESKGMLSKIVASKVRSQYPFEVKNVALQANGKNSFTATITAEFEIDGNQLEQKLNSILSFDQTQCLDCSRESGGFYDSIIQVRPYPGEEVEWEKMEKRMERLVALLEKMGAKAVKIEKTVTGFDIKVAGISPALSAARKVSQDVEHSRKLVGRKEGKDLFRHTFCARV